MNGINSLESDVAFSFHCFGAMDRMDAIDTVKDMYIRCYNECKKPRYFEMLFMQIESHLHAANNGTFSSFLFGLSMISTCKTLAGLIMKMKKTKKIGLIEDGGKHRLQQLYHEAKRYLRELYQLFYIDMIVYYSVPRVLKNSCPIVHLMRTLTQEMLTCE